MHIPYMWLFIVTGCVARMFISSEEAFAKRRDWGAREVKSNGMV
jgi:hypothetical protein